jgi:glycosyltransferase involved in cell wall biosynthesis
MVLSAAFGEILVRDYGVRADRIRVIPPGLDLGPFRESRTPSEARMLLGVADRPTVVTVRRLVNRMGIDLLIDAIARLPASSRPQLLVAGTGPERDALEGRARDARLEADVRFLGRVDDALLPAFYAAGDLCAVPTRSLEGFGYVVIESYAAGRPVLATAIGGLVEVVGPFDPDRLVGADPASLAEGLARAMARPESLPTPESCRQYAAEFGWDRIVPRVEAVFREALA